MRALQAFWRRLRRSPARRRRDDRFRASTARLFNTWEI